jgi:hypothetical protein
VFYIIVYAFSSIEFGTTCSSSSRRDFLFCRLFDEIIKSLPNDSFVLLPQENRINKNHTNHINLKKFWRNHYSFTNIIIRNKKYWNHKRSKWINLHDYAFPLLSPRVVFLIDGMNKWVVFLILFYKLAHPKNRRRKIIEINNFRDIIDWMFHIIIDRKLFCWMEIFLVPSVYGCNWSFLFKAKQCELSEVKKRSSICSGSPKLTMIIIAFSSLKSWFAGSQRVFRA